MPNEPNPVSPELTAALQKAAAARPDQEREQKLTEEIERTIHAQIGKLVSSNVALDIIVRDLRQRLSAPLVDDDLKRWMFGNLPEGHLNTLKLHEILDAKENT